jgi:hypothetical protein
MVVLTVCSHMFKPKPAWSRVTIAIASGGRVQTLTDGRSQVEVAAALTVCVTRWLRDEGASSGLSASP